MFFRKKKEDVLIGLDIGSSCLKIAQVNTSREPYELGLFGMAMLPREVISEGVISDRSALVGAIKELLAKTKVGGGDVAIGLSGHSSVIVKRITLPQMSAQDLSLSIKFEAEQYIPFDISDVNIDFQILGPSAHESGQMDVVLVAVKKSLINDYTTVLEEAGLAPAVVDVDAFAIGNVFEANYDVQEYRNVALINIGASKTNINIMQNGVPVFTRDSSTGTNFHTDAIERMMKVSREEAELLKRGESVAGVSKEAVEDVLSSASDEIYAEIYRSFEYFRSSVSDEGLQRILLSGGAAMIKGFPEMMAERLGVDVEVLNPFRNITVSEKAADAVKNAPLAVVAVGLALRRIGDKI
ncbi:MAG: type IV pilus assembly protein PilM [Nitrospiraceae bacterium]|jgi:type IV pilus assembly protein PilM|nr:type IV pilus assembly protein PilM [Nitrospiraceae bacterium]